MFSEYHKIEMSLNYVLNYIFQNISNAILSCWSGIIMILSDREYYERLKLLLERVVLIINNIKNVNTNFNNLPNKSKLIWLMSSEDNFIIKNTSSLHNLQILSSVFTPIYMYLPFSISRLWTLTLNLVITLLSSLFSISKYFPKEILSLNSLYVLNLLPPIYYFCHHPIFFFSVLF
jgi:hypothetical protein